MRDRAADRRLMRYLHGELAAEQVRELRAELARDPALQARLAELHRLWQGLQPSPPTPAPFGYVPKLQRLAERRHVETAAIALGWGATPWWARALAGAALVAGVAMGVGLGRLPPPGGAPSAAGELATATPAVLPALVARSAGTVVPGDAEPSAAATAATPSAPLAAAPVQRESPSRSPAAAEPTEAILTGETVSLAGGTTMAEEYWQALEGTGGGGEGDGGGWEGDAGW